MRPRPRPRRRNSPEKEEKRWVSVGFRNRGGESELTGNGAPVAALVAAVNPVSSQREVLESESESVETIVTTTSVDASSVDSSGTASFNQEEMNSFQPYGYYDDQMGLYSLEETRSNDMLACQADLEALLEDMDQEFPLVFEFDTNYSSESRHQIHYQQYYREEEQEADLSIYYYDFSGVVC
ncbi:unnamed protein product [Linum tenue]|uniref:Uncharacterized protein n=1 Tax=Linum tenue TaxID=586396 RepID=A0AAV0QQ99_9ROSI|nr:unnamed protein product [Linum tenue]